MCPWEQNLPWLETSDLYLSISMILVIMVKWPLHPPLLWAIIKCCIGQVLFFFFFLISHPSPFRWHRDPLPALGERSHSIRTPYYLCKVLSTAPKTLWIWWSTHSPLLLADEVRRSQSSWKPPRRRNRSERWNLGSSPTLNKAWSRPYSLDLGLQKPIHFFPACFSLGWHNCLLRAWPYDRRLHMGLY